MKTLSLKKILPVIAFAFISHVSQAQFKTIKEVDWDAYQKVQDFVEENVCNVLSAKVKMAGTRNTNYFSRCPSGYNSQMITRDTSVRPENFVDGKIVFYHGCQAKYVCHFKVCVSKNYIVLRNPGTNYMTVSDWVAARSQQSEKDKLVKK